MAVQPLVPGELARHTVAEGTKAVTRTTSHSKIGRLATASDARVSFFNAVLGKEQKLYHSKFSGSRAVKSEGCYKCLHADKIGGETGTEK
ncbi:uncharacterized protein ISCGN_018821 [Ixodes scapularis]